jgi:hypothetical protein
MFLEVSHVWRVRACGPEALSGRATSWTGHRNLAPWSSQNLLAPLLPSGYCVIDTYLPNWIYLHVEVVVDLHVWHPFGIASLLHDQDPYEWYHPLQVSRSKYSAKLGKAHCRASPTCLPTRPLPRLDLNRWDTKHGALYSLHTFVHTVHLPVPSHRWSFSM